MMFAYFPKSSAANSVPVLEAFLQGLRDLGVTCCPDNLDCDAAIIWSQLWAGRMRPNQAIYQHYRSQGRPVVIIDVGTLYRNKTWKIMLNGDARLAGHGHDSTRRDKLDIQIKPWRRQGNHILIALQRPDSNQWHGLPDQESWLTSIVSQIKQQSQRSIMIRPHPRYPLVRGMANIDINTPCRVPGTYDDFDFNHCLQNTWAVVNWNSSPGVISVLNGVPAFVGSSSLAAPVANLDITQIENPATPDRDQWCNDLAWTEWTMQEMQQGIPQHYLLKLISASQSS